MKKDIVNIGLIGCGNFSHSYLRTLGPKYTNVQVIACSDINQANAASVAEKWNIPKVCSTEELLADPEIDLVLILTNPASHYSLTMAALAAGKHVYSEKPMAITVEETNEIVALAAEKGLFVGTAPDTFLDGGFQTCRKLIDDGVIGDIIGVSASFVGPGHEIWHPNPEFYYKKGAGPALDMAPYFLTAIVSLVGPIEQFSCYANQGFSQRWIQDHMTDVEVITNYCAIMKFRNGAVGNINVSFDIWKSRQPGIEIYGTKGVIFAPDPNTLEGPVQLLVAEEMEKALLERPRFDRVKMLYNDETLKMFKNIDLVIPTPGNERGHGVSDMADAILNGGKPRVSADMSRHVTEALIAFDISSGNNGQAYKMTSTCERPAPLPID